jgi:hypothetical protein
MEQHNGRRRPQGRADAWDGIDQDDHHAMEEQARNHVLGRMNTLERRSMQDLTDVPDCPGGYFLFRVPARTGQNKRMVSSVPDDLYAPFSTGRRAVYVGKTTTTGLRSRLSWHARGLKEAGLNLADVLFAAQPCATGAWATYLEAVALETASSDGFPWNGSGFGSRAQGRRRNQLRSTFDCLHEGRSWVRSGATELDRAVAALDVAASGACLMPPGLLWGSPSS